MMVKLMLVNQCLLQQRIKKMLINLKILIFNSRNSKNNKRQFKNKMINNNKYNNNRNQFNYKNKIVMIEYLYLHMLKNQHKRKILLWNY